MLLLLFGFTSTETDPLPKGQVIEKVACADDALQTYALYLPSNYEPSHAWPVLYAFDPGARGKLPVERFKDAAETFGWIVVGSNNSRNGSMQASIDSWNAITRDTAKRFSIDPRRAYATGFSGGARTAILFATQCNDCLAGVIAGGAGFPGGIEPTSSMHFALFLIIGNEDFNLPEIKALDETLAHTQIPHQVRTWDGRHEWPPATVMVDAVSWMELQAIRSRRREPQTSFIDTRWSEKIRTARDLEDAKRLHEAYEVYAEVYSSFKGLRDVLEIEKKVAALAATPEVRNAIRDEQQELKKQRDLERQIAGFIASMDRASLRPAEATDDQATNSVGDAESRLHALLRELRQQSKLEQNVAARRIARRVLDGQYIGLFERGNPLLQTQKRLDEAVRIFTLATEVQPDRAGAFYYLAWAYAAKGDKKKSLKALQTAVDKGFKDHATVAGNKAFDSMRSDPAYLELIEKMQRAN